MGYEWGRASVADARDARARFARLAPLKVMSGVQVSDASRRAIRLIECADNHRRSVAQTRGGRGKGEGGIFQQVCPIAALVIEILFADLCPPSAAIGVVGRPNLKRAMPGRRNDCFSSTSNRLTYGPETRNLPPPDGS